jgi:hypothetical protein
MHSQVATQSLVPLSQTGAKALASHYLFEGAAPARCMAAILLRSRSVLLVPSTENQQPLTAVLYSKLNQSIPIKQCLELDT